MGGSTWDYFTPYQQDASAALAAAHERAFSEGDYFWLYDGRWGLHERPRPSTIEELWEDEGVRHSFTHSILDIFSVLDEGEQPEVCSARPLTPGEILRVLGSSRPTRATFESRYERAYGDLDSLIEDRGHACYTVLYDEHRQPSEIVFWGVTGD
ncbi:hypothetical protein [Planotetraspora kaengkrachanensis]|uniref:Uncharacterized protein n=1 Tax=Planotetraspora kaengkrachanensis TaxID=575193 RepID=A0A8J3LVC3_9ACTN|nr:hypothetical protein [Planotetraspora kaengkrachanensis]GIG79027.1 hypothetical protein Pka01_21540 [Planotetraspora kaengkrachanensis]